jgi:hypothetical protein
MDIYLLDQSHVYHFEAKENDNFYYVTIHTDKKSDFTVWEVSDKHGGKIKGPLESEMINKIRLDWKRLVK